MILAEWHVGEAVWAMLWFTLFFIWIWLLIVVFGDIFRSRDLGGFAKFLFQFCHRGALSRRLRVSHRTGSQDERACRRERMLRTPQTRAYIQDVVSTSPSAADDFSRLADLKARGVIDDAEFESLKANVLAGTTPSG